MFPPTFSKRRHILPCSLISLTRTFSYLPIYVFFFSPFSFPCSLARALSGHKLLVPDVRWGYWFLQGAWQCRIHATIYVPPFCTAEFYFFKIIPESSYRIFAGVFIQAWYSDKINNVTLEKNNLEKRNKIIYVNILEITILSSYSIM